MIAFLAVVLVGGIILLAVVEAGRSNRRRSRAPRRMPHVSLDRADFAARWQTIMAVSTTGASGLKSSINEADKLLDHALKQSGYAGATMGDRLRSAGSRFSNRNDVWSAHKLRNALAHEVGFDLVPSQAKEALSQFEQGLKDLGAL
ncbi:MAG TPA: hypothetical protein VHQ86_04200 [Candidatus Saccharimonadia bacterium]|nr:hypothetical protein [Candidatus Saccharimonadia bacterium]